MANNIAVTHEETIHTVRGKMSGKALIKAFRESGDIPMNAKDVKIQFEVPRGGDYSGMTLDMEEHSLIISYVE